MTSVAGPVLGKMAVFVLVFLVLRMYWKKVMVPRLDSMTQKKQHATAEEASGRQLKGRVGAAARRR